MSRKVWTAGVITFVGMLGLASTIAAHDFGQHDALPVPLWLYTIGAAAIAVCFVVVGVFVRAAGWPLSPLLMVGYIVISLAILAQSIMAGGMRASVATTAPQAEGMRAMAMPALTPQKARAFLDNMKPLYREGPVTSEAGIRSSLLCYCLQKAPETVRELRRIAAERFAEGITAFHMRQYTDAITAFSKTIQLHPRHTWAFVNRGLAYGRVGAYQQAHADFTRAVGLDPQLQEAAYARGLTTKLLAYALENP